MPVVDPANRVLRRPTLSAVAFVGVCCLLSTGCASDAPKRKTQVTEDGMIAPVMDTESDPAPPSAARGKSTGIARAGEWVLAVPENVVWWPWKIVGGTLRGLVDGGAAGFDNSDYPLIGAIFLPVNAATGAVTGLVEGVAMSPLLITPDDKFGKTMAKPISTPTTIWWYE